MSNSNDEANTDQSAPVTEKKAFDPLFAGVNKDDGTQELDPMSLHEDRADQGTFLKISSQNMTQAENNADHTDDPAPKSETSDPALNLPFENERSDNSLHDPYTEDNLTAKVQPGFDYAQAYAASPSTSDHNEEDPKSHEHNLAPSQNTNASDINGFYPQPNDSPLPAALKKSDHRENNVAAGEDRDFSSYRSLPPDLSPRLPKHMVQAYERRRQEEEAPIYYAPGEPLSGKPGEYFKKLKEKEDAFANPEADEGNEKKVRPELKDASMPNSDMNKPLIDNCKNANSNTDAKVAGNGCGLVDKSIFANVSIKADHEGARTEDLQNKKEAVKDTFDSSQIKHKISSASLICLYIRQFLASFFTHSILGILMPKIAGSLGPGYPSSMPFPCFLTGFISIFPFFYLLNGIMPPNNSLWTVLSVLVFFMLSGVSGFNGIVKVCSAFSNSRNSQALYGTVSVLYILTLTAAIQCMAGLLGDGMRLALIFAASSMLASLAACSLQYGLTDDPVDSFGSLTIQGLIFAVICVVSVIFLIIPPLPAVSMCGLALLLRLALGFYFEHRSIMISRAVVCGMYLTVLLILLLYMIMAAGRSLI